MKRSHTVYAAAMLALSAAAFAPAVASAQVGVSVVVGNAPPPARFESVPAPRRGHVWAPGYWNWDGNRHYWAAGHWEPERHGQQFRSAVWVRADGGWRLDPGGWVTVESRPVDNEYVVVDAPPPPRYERAPGPRPGYVWSPGYWDWRGNRHEWVAGYWIAERPGYRYYEPQWVEREGHWYRDEARWERHGRGDRDHDGIPNRYDRDRDGDGVPNRYDRHPDNPRRD